MIVEPPSLLPSFLIGSATRTRRTLSTRECSWTPPTSSWQRPSSEAQQGEGDGEAGKDWVMERGLSQTDGISDKSRNDVSDAVWFIGQWWVCRGTIDVLF